MQPLPKVASQRSTLVQAIARTTFPKKGENLYVISREGSFLEQKGAQFVITDLWVPI